MTRIKKLLCLILILALLPGAMPCIQAQAAEDEVIDGKDGWYFYGGNSTIADFQGTNLYTQDQLNVILQHFLNMKDSLAQKGIELIVLLAPNKEHIYNEYMPDNYGGLAPLTRIEQIYNCLNGHVTVIYPEQELKEAKVRYPQYDLYYRTDTHWNEVGAYIVTSLLMKELGYEMPPLEDVTVSSYSIDNLDLSEMSKRRIPDTGYTISGLQTDTPSDQRVFIAGDSFGLVMEPLLKPFVSDEFLIHRDIYEPYLLNGTQPTVFVFEIVERFLDSLLMFSAF